jgi:hypothetical protein
MSDCDLSNQPIVRSVKVPYSHEQAVEALNRRLGVTVKSTARSLPQ